ncbi:MAG TPA: HD domain-containing protein [Pirellulaceae bacterium]
MPPIPSKRFVNELVENEKITEVFLLADKQLRQNRNGNLYLQMRLTDRTGSVAAMMWNATEKSGQDVQVGDYVRVEGATQVYNGAMQMIATRVDRVVDDEVSEADFVRVTALNTAKLRGELDELLRSIRTPHLSQLVECFLMDSGLMERFGRAPAAVKNHHAYVGGLLEHGVSMMRLADLVSGHYPRLDRDILLVGAFLHDIGKVDELAYDRELSYTDEGQLIGHVVMGVQILERKLREAERLAGQPFPGELELHLKHLIVSHHGKYEFGSPKLPMTLEAVTLHYLDDLDAKLHWMSQLMDDDANTDSAWTTFHTNLGRKLFKGFPTEGPAT